MSSDWKKCALTPGSNPYTDWHRGPGRPYATPPDEEPPWFPCIVQLEDFDARSFQDLVNQLAQKGELGEPDKPVIRVPTTYLTGPNASAPSRYITALVRDNFFVLLALDEPVDKERKLRDLAPRVVLGQALAPRTISEREVRERPTLPDLPPEPHTVVVGVIDDGIAFGHERFRMTATTTRVEYAWVQDAPSLPGLSPVPYGREFTKAEIDDLLADCTHAGFLDEDKFYRRVSLIDFQLPEHKAAAWRTAHGTHAMDLACGYDPGEAPDETDDDETDNRPIVCVQLPTSTTADTSGASLEPYVSGAVDYILDRADQIAFDRKSGPLPVVINFSYGILAGPHDGTAPIEAAIDAAVAGREDAGKASVVLPSGNGHLSRCHARISFQSLNPDVELKWRVQPDDRTSSFLEIWMPHRDPSETASRMEVTVTPPGGPESPPLDEIPGAAWEWEVDGDVLCKLVYDIEPDPTQRGRFVVSMLPTGFLDPPTRLAPAGLWIVKLRNKLLGSDDLVRAWIQRDDTPYGYPLRGRQSYFDDDCYTRFDAGGLEVEEDDPSCHVKREGTINAIGTGEKVIVIGGYRDKEMTPASYSAGGPITGTKGADPPHREGPDAMAVSDGSRVHEGVMAAGSRSGSRVAMRGTSVAAPQVARLVADDLAGNGLGDREAVEDMAASDEAGYPPGTPPRPSSRRGGRGRIAFRPLVRVERYWR